MQSSQLDLLGLHVGLAARHITSAGTASGSGWDAALTNFTSTILTNLQLLTTVQGCGTPCLEQFRKLGIWAARAMRITCENLTLR